MLVIRNFDGSLADTSLITLLASERHGIFELRVTTSSICSDYRCYCYMKSINSSSGCSKLLSYLSSMAWILVSNNSSEDKPLELRVTILFSMCSYENLFGSIFFSLWTLSIIILVVQIFDHMEKYCLGTISKSDLQNMDVQSVW